MWPIYALLDLFSPQEEKLQQMSILERYELIAHRVKIGWYSE